MHAFLGFDIPTSFFDHKCFLLILFPLFFFLNGVKMFCRLQKYWCMKSFNHKVCSSMKVSILFISAIYEWIIILFHLQMMSILYFTQLQICSPTRSSVSHCVNNSVLTSQCHCVWYGVYRFYIHMPPQSRLCCNLLSKLYTDLHNSYVNDTH